MVDSGNEGCPGRTLVPAVDVRHFQFCTKRYRYHAGRAQSFTCFTRALRAADHFLQLRSDSLTQETSPSGTGACRRVLGLPRLGEVVPCSPLAAGFSRWELPPRFGFCRAACDWPCMRHQLNGLCCKNGLFHGLLLRSCHSWST